MGNRREDLLTRLEAAAAKTPLVPEDFLSPSFQILYGVPLEFQLRAACHMCERYLPIYEKKLPGSTWCRQLLGDLDAWFRAEGEATPDIPDESDSADTLYHYSFTNFLVAYHYKYDPASLTAGVCGTIIHVVHARAQNVWLADDSVAAQLEMEKDAWRRIDEEHRPPAPESFRQLWQSEHTPTLNIAFDAVYRREWLYVAEWLRAEAVWKYPDPDDMDAMMRGLERWKAREFCPMGPERTDGLT